MLRTIILAAAATLMTASAASALPCWNGIKDTCTEPPPVCIRDGDEVYCETKDELSQYEFFFGTKAPEQPASYNYKDMIPDDWRLPVGAPVADRPWMNVPADGIFVMDRGGVTPGMEMLF